MAEIYLCAFTGPEGFEKDVVIKRIRSFLANDDNFVRMFISEARLASRLNHANLVQIFDFDKHEDSFYLAMEYVRGQSLYDTHKRAKQQMMPMPSTLVAKIGIEVARGLHYAHRLTEKGKWVGLVHRDVTPQNILLAYEGAVKLTDFGVAKSDTRFTSPGMLKGKFAYMSPEQARGDEVDARTDVFALGVVLWELLTGARLFEGDSDVAVLKAVQQSTIGPPSGLNSDVPEELSGVVMKALERDRDRRFATAGDFGNALAEFLIRFTKTLEDADVGAYLRRIFGDEEISHSGPARESTGSTIHEPSPGAPADFHHTPVPVPMAGEPTALLGPARHNLVSHKPVLSPDDDPQGQTWRVQHDLVFPPPPLPPPTATSSSSNRRFQRRTIAWAIAAAVAVPVAGAIVIDRVAAHRTQPQAPTAHSKTAVSPPQVPPPIPSVRPLAPAVLAIAPQPAPTVAAPPTERPPAPQGILVIRVNPWGEVSIDGKKQGMLRQTHTFKIKPGRHHVLVVHNKDVMDRWVVVGSGKRVVETFDAMAKIP